MPLALELALPTWGYHYQISSLYSTRVQVRVKINALSEGWSREQKDHCLAETEASFKVCWGGGVAVNDAITGCRMGWVQSVVLHAPYPVVLQAHGRICGIGKQAREE
jgi:hypothetical protein